MACGVAVEAGPTIGAMVTLAETLLGTGRHDEARALYRHLANAVPDDTLAISIQESAHPALDGSGGPLPALGLRALDLPGVREAPARLQEAYLLLGCDLEQTSPQQALRCYRVALVIQPDYAAAHDRCGRVLRRLERIEESVACFGRSLALDPRLRDAAIALAVLASRLGRYEEALAALTMSTGATDDLARLNEAMLLLAHQRLDDALAKTSALFFRQPGLHAAHGLLAQILERMGMPAEAAEVSQPDFATLARVYMKRGALDAAGSLLRTLHAQTGSVPKTLLALAEWQLETSLYHQAEHYLSPIDPAALDDSERALFTALLARLRIRQKNVDEAARLLHPYRHIAPQSWLILLPWLELCVATGIQPGDEDMRALDRWCALLAHDVQAQHHAARLLFAFGRVGQATDVLDRLVTRCRWMGTGGSVLASKRWFDTYRSALAIAEAQEDVTGTTPRKRAELFRTLDQDYVDLHRIRQALGLGRPRASGTAGTRPETRISMTQLGRHGRFGNQVFQYAFLKLYAHRHGLVAEAPDWCGRYLFGADDPVAQEDLPPFYAYFHEDLAFQALEGAAPPLFNGRDIRGFFMPHTTHYAPYRDAFRALFRPGPAVAPRIDRAIAALKGNGERTLVAVHVRRGDFGDDRFWVYPEHFYLGWLERIWPSLRRPVLYVASDDPSVVRTFSSFAPTTGAEVAEGIEGAPYFIDHCVMRHADCLLISNSTFSVSASLLNEVGRHFFRPPAKDMPLVRFDPWNDRVMR